MNMLGRTASANRCDLSSGGSDSAMDTDAYLESLIRKQKIPRTQNIKASGIRHKQIGGAAEPQTSTAKKASGIPGVV